MPTSALVSGLKQCVGADVGIDPDETEELVWNT